MSSNVLKTKNDCYNFNDENSGDNKPKAKQRQRLRTYNVKSTKGQSLTEVSNDLSKSVSKESQKRDHKWRCDTIKEVISKSSWLNDIRAERRSTVDSVLTLLNKHTSDDCKCVNICSSHLLFGNTYFELFLVNRNEFENRVINEENKDLDPKTSDDSNATKNVMNDIPTQKDSKLESSIFPNLVNLNNMSALLAPLDQAVHHWNEGFELSLKMCVLTEESVMGFKIYYNLSSVIQIYSLYNQIECRLKVAELLNKFTRNYGSKHSEISLTANYYLVKTYLELGAISKASHCLTRTPVSSSSGRQTEQRLPETFGKSLNLLAKCEIDFMSGHIERAAKTLKAFIESEYLQKLTINRYYVKGVSLFMATKFLSKDFDFSQYFQEFLEPIQMSLSILKRWNPWLSSSVKTNSENVINSGDLDPIWYKYAVMNFAFEAMQMSAHFYANIEMPIDSIWYFNTLMRLGRRYCTPVRLSKLLVVGSQLDMLCDHKSSAQTKLANASLCLQSRAYSSSSESVFDSHSVASTISPDTKRVLKSQSLVGQTFVIPKRTKVKSDPEIEVIEVIQNNRSSGDSEDCGHNKVCNLWDLKKKFQRNNLSDSDDSIEEIGRNMTQLSFDQNDYQKGILELFFAKMEVDLQTLLVNETDSEYILRQMNDIHKNSFESYTSNVLKQQIEELLSDYHLKDLQNNCDYYKSLKFKIFEIIAGIQVQLKEFKDAINTCNEISVLKASTYEQRVNQSNLLYFEAFSKLQLYKSKHNINDSKFWIEYNTLEDIPSCDMLSEGQTVTPTRPQNKLKASVPNAPKQKQYINDEMQDYMTALSNAIYEESKANTSSAVNDKNSLRFKSTAKLNLENDTELRSLSVNESNLTTDENVSQNMISTEVPSKRRTASKSTTTGRVTRSRTFSLKANSKCSESKNEKSHKRSTLKSKTESDLIEIIDLENDFDNELEELDEVFCEKLSIVDKKQSKVCPKESELSLESIIAILNGIFDIMSSHPISKLYVSIHKLLTEIHSISDDINEELIGYHFSESVRSTYRYRNLFIAEKKRKLNKSPKYDLNSIIFSEKNIEPKNSCRIFTDSLPTDWRIVQIMAVNNESKIPELMVCRYQSGKKPIYLRIKSDPQKILKDFMTNFAEIIERSNASIVNKDRETFWRLRYSLDEELMVLLRSVEDTWFGPFKGILFGQLNSEGYNRMCRRLRSYFLETASFEDLECVSEPLLGVVVESLPYLKRDEFEVAMKVLFKTSSKALFIKCFAKYEEMFCDVYPIDNKESIFTNYHLSPVGLILDKSLESFPFECLPTLQALNESIFRTPSLRILSLMYNTFKDGVFSKGVDESKVYYVLNPSDNLAKTEEYFKESFLTMKEWDGVIGKPPNPMELKDAFDSKEAYIFFGHGAGASYYRTIPDGGLDGCSVNSASVVIGCSSGKLFSDGKQLESYGTPFRFLMNGCPSYVGVLWDVTDKDIDKFSDQLLTFWFSKWKPELKVDQKVIPNTKAVSKSRQSCRLKYLIGAAPVVYGLPLFTKM